MDYALMVTELGGQYSMSSTVSSVTIGHPFQYPYSSTYRLETTGSSKLLTLTLELVQVNTSGIRPFLISFCKTLERRCSLIFSKAIYSIYINISECNDCVSLSYSPRQYIYSLRDIYVALKNTTGSHNHCKLQFCNSGALVQLPSPL